ncbi:MAG TPA: amino acid racemase [Candidatus Binatus sp.]|nr:amino acid racemase [Candidatus Binatus sp.]
MIGVVGGMGPDATVLFLTMVIELTEAQTDQDHVDLDCLMHASIPDRTAFILGRSAANPVPSIQADLALLASRGATAVAIPCNTAHYFYDQLQAGCPVPILNMLELAAASVRRRYPDARRVAVLGTRGTVETGVYRAPCERVGLSLVPIPEPIQQLADTVIFERVKAGIPVEERLYLDLLEGGLRAGADVVLLACTELSVPERLVGHRLPTVDAMVALAEATVLAAGKRLRPATGGSPA